VVFKQVMGEKTPESNVTVDKEKVGTYHNTTGNLNSLEKSPGVPNPKRNNSGEHENDEQISTTFNTADNESKSASHIPSQSSSTSLQSLPDEGYQSRRTSGHSLRSNQSTTSLDNCTNTFASEPIQEEDVDEDQHSNDEVASITENLDSISLTDCTVCNNNSLEQGRNMWSQTRRHSYEPPHPSARFWVRRCSETAVAYRRKLNLIPAKMSLHSEAGPACIMCRRNSQPPSPPTKRKISLTRSYIFKAVPIRRWNSEIFTVSPHPHIKGCRCVCVCVCVWGGGGGGGGGGPLNM